MVQLKSLKLHGISVRCLLLSGAVLLSLMLNGCQAKPEDPPGQRYDFKGKVVAVDKKAKRVTVEHEEIKGYMDAMTMPFALKDDWPFEVLVPGDKISATLFVGSSSSWLEDVVITQESAMDPNAPKTEGSNVVQPGDAVPDYGLTNQDDQHIHLGQYHGKALLLTFIYTRCPLPEYCTLMSNNFAEIDKELEKNPSLYERTHLLSVSFDPQYDTPNVLRSYGAAHTGKFAEETFQHWEFASGTPDEVKGMAQFFGLRYYQDTGQIIHSLSTAIITPDGKIYKVYRGNEWKPSEVLRDVQSLLGEQQR
ncbi:MAG TPA: SCO family protein [Pyrinomonadaceae bacterium]|nr:SCO family protein [Pyrinomonadaceae bacterium]